MRRKRDDSMKIQTMILCGSRNWLQELIPGKYEIDQLYRDNIGDTVCEGNGNKFIAGKEGKNNTIHGDKDYGIQRPSL